MWPAGSTAERSFSDRPKTFGACSLPAGAREALFSSSPTVSTSIRCGDDPAPLPPTSCVSGSSTLVTLLPRLRSYQSLPTIPLTDGVAPLIIVEWPTAVTVG